VFLLEEPLNLGTQVAGHTVRNPLFSSGFSRRKEWEKKKGHPGIHNQGKLQTALEKFHRWKLERAKKSFKKMVVKKTTNTDSATVLLGRGKWHRNGGKKSAEPWGGKESVRKATGQKNK